MKRLTRQLSFEGCFPFPQSPRGRGSVWRGTAPVSRARLRGARRPTEARRAAAPDATGATGQPRRYPVFGGWRLGDPGRRHAGPGPMAVGGMERSSRPRPSVPGLRRFRPSGSPPKSFLGSGRCHDSFGRWGGNSSSTWRTPRAERSLGARRHCPPVGGSSLIYGPRPGSWVTYPQPTSAGAGGHRSH